jgi:hypothetical protein
MDEGALVWSLYDDIKREILRLYSILYDSFNNYRMLVSTGRHQAAKDHYLTAGKALRKMTTLCVMSGAWPRTPTGLEELRGFNAEWFNNGVETKIVLARLDIIEKNLEEWFTVTHFFDIRVDSGRRGVLDVSEVLGKMGL